MTVKGKEGPELLPTRPALAVSHLELYNQGETILIAINEFFKEEEKSSRLTESLIKQLLGLLSSIAEFVVTTLSIRDPNNGVAY